MKKVVLKRRQICIQRREKEGREWGQRWSAMSSKGCLKYFLLEFCFMSLHRLLNYALLLSIYTSDEIGTIQKDDIQLTSYSVCLNFIKLPRSIYVIAYVVFYAQIE